MFGIVGSALGIVFGGLIAAKIDWRYAFFIVGIAGIAVAPLFKLTVREPPRGRYDKAATDTAPPLSQIIVTLTGKPSFWLMSLGGASSSMMGYGLFFWLPSLFVRR